MDKNLLMKNRKQWTEKDLETLFSYFLNLKKTNIIAYDTLIHIHMPCEINAFLLDVTVNGQQTVLVTMQTQAKSKH